MRRSLSVGLLLLTSVQGKWTCAQASEQVETGQVDLAGKTMPYRIRRLPLSAFPELPAPVRDVLQERRCTVPQTYQARRPENVIQGEFWQKGSRDWAVLCSHDGASFLLVFHGNALGLPVELESGKDIERLQPRSNGTLGFAWGLDIAQSDDVRRVAGGKSHLYDHDGIQASIVETSSRIYYYLNGKWLQFDGAE